MIARAPAGYLALLDDEHAHLLDAHQEWIEVVGALEQRIVLQADPAAAPEVCSTRATRSAATRTFSSARGR